LSEHGPLDAQRTLNDEVLKVVRQHSVIPGGRAHFDDRLAFNRGSNGIAAFSGAQKKSRASICVNFM
jgi:hypothetical protein